jgi:hypothetical protein
MITRLRLTDYEQRVYTELLTGKTSAALAREYGVSRPAIGKIKANIRRKGYALPGYEGVDALRGSDPLRDALDDLIQRKNEIEAVIAFVLAEIDRRTHDRT